MIEVKSDYDGFQRVNKILTSVVSYQDDDKTTKSEENKMESMTAVARDFLLFIVTALSLNASVRAASYCYYSYYYSNYRCYYYYYYYYDSSVGTIAGAVIGGLFALAVVIGIIVFICVVVCKCKTTGVRGRVVQPGVGVSNNVTYINSPSAPPYNSGFTYGGTQPMNTGPMPPAYTNQAPPEYQPPPPAPQYNDPVYPPPQYQNITNAPPPTTHEYR